MDGVFGRDNLGQLYGELGMADETLDDVTYSACALELPGAGPI